MFPHSPSTFHFVSTFKTQANRLQLSGKLISYSKAEGQNCLLFVTYKAAEECIAFATASARGDDKMSADELKIRVFDIDVRLFGVFFPAPKTPVVMPFWNHPGVGISSRLAEESLKHLDLLHEVTASSAPPKLEETPAHSIIRERIAGLLERATSEDRSAKVQAEDVYLFQTGMASIYLPHQWLVSKFGGTTVLFGFAFHSTIHVFEDFGPGCKLLGLGTEEELDVLDTYLEAELKEGRKVQAAWCEFPSNPILATPDLGRLRKLADKYDLVLIVDETIGSFCNLDVMGAADVVVTSLTKSFSGYADVMGASAVLNPSSKRYPELKALFRENYENNLYNADAEVLEKNSRNYMERSIILNNNSARIVEYLQAQVSKPDSSVARVYYPSVAPSKANYEARMRKKTADFTPGYSCLLSVEFDTVESTIAFYDNLNVYHGPHLGAHLTLAMPYVKGLYAKELDWAAKYALKETQVRIAPGLEDTELLLEDFRIAVRAADEVKAKFGKEGIAVEP
jgi:cystathionine gamma-synthase